MGYSAVHCIVLLFFTILSETLFFNNKFKPSEFTPLIFYSTSLIMKIWTSEHVFEHDWVTVVNAAWRKYPNPISSGVTGMDVVRQSLSAGKILSERLIQSHFHIPTWATKLTGFSGTQYSHEYTVIDPAEQKMSLTTRNLNGASFLRVDEKITYTPLASDPSKTVLKQEAIVTITLPAFADYCEKTFLSVYSNNANKGRKGVEWVIDHLKKEYSEISDKLSSEVHEMGEKMRHAFGSNPR